MSYGYSAKTNIFYVMEGREQYEQYNNWPSDVKEVSDKIWEEFSKQGPQGKIRGANKKGLPSWVDALPPSKEEMIYSAVINKANSLKKAKEAIEPLTDALELKIATGEEKERLKQWKLYRVLLNRIDTNNAPDIEWPEVPNDVA